MGTGKSPEHLVGRASDEQLVLLRQAGGSHDHDLPVIPPEVIDRCPDALAVRDFDADLVPGRGGSRTTPSSAKAYRPLRARHPVLTCGGGWDPQIFRAGRRRITGR